MCFWLFSADPPLPQSISMRDAWIPCPLITAHIHQGGYTWSLIIYFGLPKVNPSFRKLQVCDKKHEYHCFRLTHLIVLFCNLTLQLLFPWPISALIVFLFIGPRSDRSLRVTHWLTHSMTDDLLELMSQSCWRWNELTLADGIKYLSNADVEMKLRLSWQQLTTAGKAGNSCNSCQRWRQWIDC